MESTGDPLMLTLDAEHWRLLKERLGPEMMKEIEKKFGGAWRYFHIGTGNTESRYYCHVCDGFYGVPHDGDTHKHTRRGQFISGCACAPCQQHFGVYPRGGEFRWVPAPLRPLQA